MSSCMSFANFGSSFSFATVFRLTQSFLVAGRTPNFLSRCRVSGTSFTRTSKWSKASPGKYGAQNGLRSAYQFSSTRCPERRSRSRTYLPSSSPPRSISSTSSTTTAIRCLVLRAVSGLDAFSRYPHSAWLLGNALPDNPYTRGADPPFLSYLRDLPLRHQSASTKKQQTCLTTV